MPDWSRESTYHHCSVFRSHLYDTSDKVRSTSDNVFAFAPRRQYVQPKITYYTPNSPEGVMLPVTQLDSGYIQVLIPGLHVYGIVAVEEQG